MVGSAIVRILQKNKNNNIIKVGRNKLDLTNQKAVENFFKKTKIDEVYLASAKVGGIYANNVYPANFIYDNAMIQTNIIHSSYSNKVKKLLFLGSSCIYPKFTKQPMQENQLLTGLLEPTNEAYAISKILGIKMCESYNRQFKKLGIDFRSVMPTNLYGVGDKYDLMNSHVIPGLIRRFHYAKIKKKKQVTVWGTGKPKREFLYVDDLARACVFIMDLKKDIYNRNIDKRNNFINIGSGKEISIKDLAYKIKDIIGFEGKLLFDKTKPDGTPLKLLNSNRIKKLGWKPKVKFEDGLIMAYDEFLKRQWNY